MKRRRAVKKHTVPYFLEYVCKIKDTYVIIKVRKAYDEYVRDILIEGCLECRAIGYSPNGKNERGKYPSINNIFYTF